MGTRGLRVVRFRKRYYVFWNQFDSYPEGLGTKIVAEIPTDAVKYQEWLTVQRKTAEEWEVLYEDFLSVKPGNQVIAELPDFMQEHHPSYIVPINDTWIEWIYTVDLDGETFSVNNGAHFNLQEIPHIDWISSLASGCLGDTIILPGTVPTEAVTHLVAHPTSANSELYEALDGLTVTDTAALIGEIVVPKNLKDIPWRQRHGPIMRSGYFFFWSHANEDRLGASLLQLRPEEYVFRELAYAVLCLAAGGKHVSVVSRKHGKSNGVHCFKNKGPRNHTDSEYFSVLGSGAHLEGRSPGSSPEASIYWLENVLVVLTTQLYRRGAAEEGIACIARYCQKNRPFEYVDAVLISIEHVVLVHVAPDGEVQRTPILPLINIQNHLTLSVSDRYAKPYLEKLAAKDDERFMRKEAKKKRKAGQARVLKNEGMNIRFGDDDEEGSDEEEDPALRITQVGGDSLSTFYALVHLFEAAARKQMPLDRVNDGVLPNEIYTQIVKAVTDPSTRESLMKVSRMFRRICQEDLFFTEDLILEPSESCQDCTKAGDLPNWFELRDLANGRLSPVSWEKKGGFLDNGNPSWMVAIGSEYGKKSLLPEAAFRFKKIDSPH